MSWRKRGVKIASETGVKANQFHSLIYAFNALMLTGDAVKASAYYKQLSGQHMHMPNVGSGPISLVGKPL